MRALCFVAVCFALGCGGTTSGTKKVVDADKRFDLKAENANVTLKQGESQTVGIAVSRGKQFDDDVEVSCEAPSGSGLTCDLDSKVARQKTTKMNLNVKADPDARPGVHKVKIVGKPPTGSASEVQLSIKIEKK